MLNEFEKAREDLEKVNEYVKVTLCFRVAYSTSCHTIVTCTTSFRLAFNSFLTSFRQQFHSFGISWSI